MIIEASIARDGCMKYNAFELGIDDYRVISVCRDFSVIEELARQAHNKPVTLGHFEKSRSEVDTVGYIIKAVANKEKGTLDATMYIDDSVDLSDVGFSLDYLRRVKLMDDGAFDSYDEVMDSVAIVKNPRCGEVCMI